MLKEQIVVITGASSGIGAEMARLFASYGATVCLLARSEEKLIDLSAHIGKNARYYVTDVTSDEGIKHTFDRILHDCGKIDILINNAGFAKFQLFTDTSMEDVEAMMNVNYFGLVRCTRAALPSMLERKSGHIVNIASLAGKIGTARSTAYTATKHAVLGWTNSLRQEVHGMGITVTAINPGPIDTPFFDLADPGGEYIGSMPKWFVLTPEKVAHVVFRAVVKKKAEVDVPWIGGFGVRLLSLLPRKLDPWLGKIWNFK